MRFEVGMYVRCPVDWESEEEPRRFALGQIINIDRTFEIVEVAFHDLDGTLAIFEHISSPARYHSIELSRCLIAIGSHVKFQNQNGKVLHQVPSDSGDFHEYYVQLFLKNEKSIRKLPEDKLSAMYNAEDADPLTQLKKLEIQNPRWYRRRIVVSRLIHLLENSIFGFETLVGSRVHLLPHQINTIVRCLSEQPCRFLIADEVGLGKTIQACVILKGLKEQVENLKTIFIIPESLVDQWQTELKYKFNIHVPIWKGQNLTTESDIIVPLEEMICAQESGLFSEKWDMCVVDETHRLLKMGSEYNHLLDLSKEVKHLLLLSATPVQERKSEYHGLLSLLKPEQYLNMTEENFEELVRKQAVIQKSIYSLMEDLQVYLEDDLVDDFIEELEEIDSVIQDKGFSLLLQQIDPDSEDQGLSQVKLCLAYLAEYYRMERHVIRNRRQVIEDKLARRELEYFNYRMIGSEDLYFERTVYDGLLEYLKDILQERCDSIEANAALTTLLPAVFSSAWALKSQIILMVEQYPKLKTDRLLSLIRVLEQWIQASDEEIESCDWCLEDPERIKGRLLFALDYIDQECQDEKIVIFSNYPVTLKKMAEALESYYGKETYVTFHRGIDKITLHSNADKFQNEDLCRFILCDQLGGEGRNFQIADKVVHLDLPWSANDIEQRIGRLDRIGRDVDKPVKSIVFTSEDTIETQILVIWRDVLKIFDQSLSGLEIILGELNENILSSIRADLEYGLTDAVEGIKAQIEKMEQQIKVERLFDMASHLDSETKDQLFILVDKFNENDGEAFQRIMLSWSAMTGLKAHQGRNQECVFDPRDFSSESAKNTLLSPPDWTYYKWYLEQRSRYDIQGTFSRSESIHRENLLFFAPGDPIFDCIVNNAMKCSRGRATAFVKLSAHDWRGLVFIWSISPDISFLLDQGADLRFMTKFRGTLPIDQLITVHSFTKDYEITEQDIVKDLILEYTPDKDFCHLGKRSKGNSNRPLLVKALGKDYPHFSNFDLFKRLAGETWPDKLDRIYLKNLKIAQSRVDKLASVKQAEEQFEQIIMASHAADYYYQRDSSETRLIEKNLFAVLQGLKKPIIKLDSLAFVWMVKE